jgi:hypothetical protein
MELLVASLVCVIAALSVGVHLLLRRLQNLELRYHDLSSRLDELQSLVMATRQAIEQPPTATQATEHVGNRRSAADPLARIEQLADPVMLADHNALDETANQIGGLPAGVATHLFDANEKSVAITRLIQHGHSLREISHRLHIPLGEVELLVSLRSS